MKPKAGDIFTVPYPFRWGDITLHDPEDGREYTKQGWIPGCADRFVHPDTSELIYHGIGEMILTVVSVHKPGKYRERVFYTRKFKTPDGVVFGKDHLRIKVIYSFKKLATHCLYFDNAEHAPKEAKSDTR